MADDAIIISNMGIHIAQIGPSTSIKEIRNVLTAALREISPAHDSPIQFEVKVDARNSADQYRCGLLILPTYDIGRRFLREFGGTEPRRSVTVEGSRLVFTQKQDHPPSTGSAVERPSNVPRQDRQNPARFQACKVPIASIQFGWECRDSVYSIEWEKDFIDKPCYFSFNPYRREFTFKMIGDDHNTIIVIQAAQISWASPSHITTTKSALFLSLKYPPTYEEEFKNVTNTERKPQLRQQLQSLDEHQFRCVPWASLAIRVECVGMQTPALQWLFKEAHVPCKNFSYPVEHRGLFSPRVQARYYSWVGSLPWQIAFHIEAITRDRLTDLKEMLVLRPDIAGMLDHEGPSFVADFLQRFACELKGASEQRALKPWTKDHVRELYLKCRRRFQRPKDRQEEQTVGMGSFLCFHVMVSPTTQRLQGPSWERANRIIRRYWDHRHNFIVVSFVDDAQLPVQYRFDPQVDTLRFIRKRYGEVLTSGITVAGRHFEYLHYSMSGLRQHSFWFLIPFSFVTPSGEVEKVTAEVVLRKIGDIPHDSKLLYCPALLGARWAQAFTATDAAVTVEAEELLLIEDEIDASGTRSFTDGVGTISPALLQDIWDELLQSGFYKRFRTLECPSALQFRLGGAKGVLMKDHRLAGRAVCLRPSQMKFQAPHSRQIEVVSIFYKPGKFALNRMLIMLLEGLGIQGGYTILKTLQDGVVQEASLAKKSLVSASKLMDTYGLGVAYRLPTLLCSLDRLHIEIEQLGHRHQRLMQFAVHHVLRDLKYYARIPAPGYTLVGVADIHKYLKEGQIFAYVAPIDGSEPVYLEGPVMVFRSPTTHPGDVRIVHAIGKPPEDSPFQREPLRNTVVFSVLGSRPLASCLSGGDLDGDTYVCTAFPPLLLSRPSGPYPPAEYERVPRKTVPRPSTKDDMINFVVEYLYSNNIGIITNEWLLHADQQEDGVFSEECLLLAGLHSAAVDYPKTGVPVPLHDIPKRKRREKPDWSRPELSNGDTNEYYPSDRWIGQLYRAIELPELSPAYHYGPEGQDDATLQDAFDEFKARMSSPQDAMDKAVAEQVSRCVNMEFLDIALFKEICRMYDEYRTRLSAIRHSCTLTAGRSHNSAPVTPLTEQEVMLGTISAPCAQSHRRKELISRLRGQTDCLCRDVHEGLTGTADADTASDEDMLSRCNAALHRAWTAYGLSLVNKGREIGAESFGCLALVEIFDIIGRINGYTAVVHGREHPE
ncbi:hypothetical protein NM688_g3370 [Phlebia brevispora]|uniref:Uncharacterized protein n=1 Tax=Phlebia brevispora TaxID=194682 RepID=A0ACC1T662_9APHY|nr:hypothetical protein NM688_g3370 [Phlebia brevispora]